MKRFLRAMLVSFALIITISCTNYVLVPIPTPDENGPSTGSGSAFSEVNWDSLVQQAIMQAGKPKANGMSSTLKEVAPATNGIATVAAPRTNIEVQLALHIDLDGYTSNSITLNGIIDFTLDAYKAISGDASTLTTSYQIHGYTAKTDGNLIIEDCTVSFSAITNTNATGTITVNDTIESGEGISSIMSAEVVIDFSSASGTVTVDGDSQDIADITTPTTPSHTHSFSEEPIGYELKNGRVYEIYGCECGETQETALGTAQTTLNLTGDVTEEDLAKIGKGMILITDNANAQSVLDHIRSGCTVYFTAGTYTGTNDPNPPENAEPLALRIRPSRYNGTRVRLNSDQGEWKEGEELTEIDDAVAASLTATNDYILELNDIRFIGDDDAVFNVGFEIKATHIYQPSETRISPYDAVREIYLQNFTNSSYYAKIKIDGISFENMHFDYDDYIINAGFADDESYLRNFSVYLSSFIDSSGTPSSKAAIRLQSDSEGMYENIEVTDSNFSNVFQGVYVQGATNVTVEDCNFASTGHNAIAVQSGGSNHFNGDIRISGNTFTNIGDRPIRFGNGENANILIANNDFTTCTNEDGDLAASGEITGCNIIFENNLYNGNVITEPVIDDTQAEYGWIVKIPQ